MRNVAWITTEDTILTEAESLNNAQIVADLCMGWGWDKASICALCGNMRAESWINPNIWEFGYNHSLERGYGLVQWTPATKLIDWANANGLDHTNGDTHMARINYETINNIQWGPKIYGTPPYDFRSFALNTNDNDVATLTEYFIRFYEAPANLDSLPARIAFAELCFNTLTFNGSGGTVIHPLLPVLEGTPITSPFGPRDYDGFHYGVDYGGSLNDPIYATMAGTVIYATYDSARGNYVIVQHSQDSYYSVYEHANSLSVSVGTVVQQGTVLALMGTTGDSTGVHLHFGIGTTPYGHYADDGQVGVFIDPVAYLASSIVIDGDPPAETSKMPALIHLLLSQGLYGAW